MTHILSRESLGKYVGLIAVLCSALATVMGVAGSIISLISPAILESIDRKTIEELYKRDLPGNISLLSIVFVVTTLSYVALFAYYVHIKLRKSAVSIRLHQADKMTTLYYKMGDERSIHKAIALLKKQLDNQEQSGS